MMMIDDNDEASRPSPVEYSIPGIYADFLCDPQKCDAGEESVWRFNLSLMRVRPHSLDRLDVSPLYSLEQRRHQPERPTRVTPAESTHTRNLGSVSGVVSARLGIADAGGEGGE